MGLVTCQVRPESVQGYVGHPISIDATLGVLSEMVVMTYVRLSKQKRLINALQEEPITSNSG